MSSLKNMQLYQKYSTYIARSRLARTLGHLKVSVPGLPVYGSYFMFFKLNLLIYGQSIIFDICFQLLVLAKKVQVQLINHMCAILRQKIF